MTQRTVKFTNSTSVSDPASSSVLPNPPVKTGDVILITSVVRAKMTEPFVMFTSPSVAVELPTAVKPGEGNKKVASAKKALFSSSSEATGNIGALVEKAYVTLSEYAVIDMVPYEPPDKDRTDPVLPCVVKVAELPEITTAPEAVPLPSSPSLSMFSYALKEHEIIEMAVFPSIPPANCKLASDPEITDIGVEPLAESETFVPTTAPLV